LIQIRAAVHENGESAIIGHGPTLGESR
jgi:hypothetical protein